eukprot:537672-Lingulodinium_polyedra.AAC.1
MGPRHLGLSTRGMWQQIDSAKVMRSCAPGAPTQEVKYSGFAHACVPYASNSKLTLKSHSTSNT